MKRLSWTRGPSGDTPTRYMLSPTTGICRKARKDSTNAPARMSRISGLEPPRKRDLSRVSSRLAMVRIVLI